MTTWQEPTGDDRRVQGEVAATVDAANAGMHVDRCIEAYATRCRLRIPAFVAAHSSLERAWSTQKRTLWWDLAIGPVNSVWALPYWTIRKVCTGLDSLGVPGADTVLRFLSPGVTSGYQKATDAALARELLEWDVADESMGLPSGLVRDIERHPALPHLRLDRHVSSVQSVRRVLDEFAKGRASIADLAGAGFTIAVSWLAFRSVSLGLVDMANRFARQDAKSRAASHFVLGRRAGSVFFSVFRPEASLFEIAIILVLLALVVAAGAMLCGLATEPVLNALGLQQRRLAKLVDKLERELVVLFHTHVKSTLMKADAGNVAMRVNVTDEHLRG